MNNNYVLGLDIGITSVGWGVINQDGEKLACGVRLFEEADKDNNVTRRDKRSSRRIKRRKKQRILEMRRLLLREGIIDRDFKALENPYKIRVKGLNESLSNLELATALLHLVKRRGSSLETLENVEEGSVDDQKAKENLSVNSQTLVKDGLHVCQLQLKWLENDGKVRGHQNIFKTEDYLAEAEAILSIQDVSDTLYNNALELIGRRRHYSEGPGSYTSPTPYGRYRKDEDGHVNEEPLNLIELMRGKCSIYPEELRAPKESFSAELHNFLNDLNNLKFQADFTELSMEQKDRIIDEIISVGYLKPKTNQAKGLADFLGVNLDQIRGFRIDKNKKPLLTEFKGYQKILKALGKTSGIIKDVDVLDKVADVLTSNKLMTEREKHLLTLGLQKEDVAKLSSLKGFTEYHSFSFKALNLLNNEMRKTTRNQMQIIQEENLIQKNKPSALVLDEDAILSPVAKRAHREALKVINHLTKEFGYFRKIVVETTREKNSKDRRKQISELQKRNEQRNKEVLSLLDAKNLDDIELSGKQKLKIRLYKEQDGKCAYTYQPLNLLSIVHSVDDYEIDHIIPYSISLDNSLNNKVLVERKANQLKGNRSPYAYFMSGKAFGEITNYQDFKDLVLASGKYSRRKKLLLTNEENLDKFDTKEQFIARNLVDTSYAVRSLMTTIKNYYKEHEIPTIVQTMKGKNTSLFRGIGTYEFYKRYPHAEENALEKNRDKYKHHAIDALICARLSEQSTLEQMYQIYREKEVNDETGEVTYDFSPFEDTKLMDFIVSLGHIQEQDVRYSWKIDSKPNRSFSDETIYSTRLVDDEEYVVKKYKDIYSMDSKTLKKIFENEKKYTQLLVYKNDYETYKILEGLYNQYKHEKFPFAAFQEETGEKVRKYSKKGNSPFITNLKYIDKKLGSHVDISQNYKLNDKKVVLLQISPYRTDFYQRSDGSIGFVTIKRVDLKPQGDYHNRYYEIDQKVYNEKLREKNLEDAKFLHSFNRNELIEIHKKEKDGSISVNRNRFIGTKADDRNIIEVKGIDSKDEKRLTPVISGTIVKIIKYSASPTGKMKKVEKEKLKLRV